MNATELRIGNWVIYQDDVNKVRYEMEFNIGHFMGIFEGNYGPPEPIPLTEKWLKKFDFIKYKNDTPYYWATGVEAAKFMRLYYDVDTEKGGGFSLKLPRKFFTKINHVHQLQNLYFALTGEELEIK